MMHRGDVLKLLDEERRTLPRAGYVLDVLDDVTRLSSTDGTLHFVLYSSLAGRDADAVIEREVAHHRALGVGFEWTACAHDEPGDLLERLRRHGFEIGLTEAVMIYDLASPPAWMEHASGVNVRCVDDDEMLGVFRAVAEGIFGKDYAFTTNQLAEQMRTGSTQHRGYVAFAPTGEPAGVGRLYTHPGSAFGGLYGGGTLPTFRGQGVYRATVAARACDALAAGMRYLQVDALPTSRPILERLGFERITDTWACEWSP